MSRRATVLALLCSGALAFGLGSAPWATATGATALDPAVRVTAGGTSAAPMATAAALVVLAGALALGLVKRAGRWAVLAVSALAGIAMTASAIAVIRDPFPAVRAAAADATGVTEITGPVSLGPAVWALGAVGVAIVATVLLAIRSSGRWASASTRHEAVGPRPAAIEGERDMWDALSDGDDPT